MSKVTEQAFSEAIVAAQVVRLQWGMGWSGMDACAKREAIDSYLAAYHEIGLFGCELMDELEAMKAAEVETEDGDQE